MDPKRDWMVYDTATGERTFFQDEREALEAFEEAVAQLLEQEEFEEEVIILEVKQTAKIVKSVSYS